MYFDTQNRRDSKQRTACARERVPTNLGEFNQYLFKFSSSFASENVFCDFQLDSSETFFFFIFFPSSHHNLFVAVIAIQKECFEGAKKKGGRNPRSNICEKLLSSSSINFSIPLIFLKAISSRLFLIFFAFGDNALAAYPL